jgi:hypothetical protein
MAIDNANRAQDDDGDDVFQPYEIMFNEKFALQSATTVMCHMVLNLQAM